MTRVNFPKEKCSCGQEMALKPSVGDEATTTDGIPCYWHCACGESKFGDHLTPDEVQALPLDIDLIEELEKQGVDVNKQLIEIQENELAERIMKRQDAIHQADFQRQLTIGRAQGIVLILEHFLTEMKNTKKRTVKKEDILKQHAIYKAAVDKHAAAIRAAG